MFSFGIGSAGSSLKGIASYYSYQPVVFSGDGDYSLTCTHIGVDATGTVLYGSRRNGIHVGGSGGTITIGGANPADKNIVSGVGVWNSQSTPQGILLQSQSDVIIQGNIIGSDITQSLDFGNTYSGISITSGLSAGASYQIGGTGEGEGNSILGNNSYGLSIESNNAVSTIIEGNTFSLAADGVTSIRNNTANILVRFPENLVRIGSAIEGGGNILGGTTYGILVWRSLPSVPVEIYGNYIGTDITGTIANQLTSRGIYLNATSSGSGDIDGVIIGGPNPGEGNVIAPGSTASIYGLANGADNIRNVTIEGNNIGIGPDGVTPITNFFSTYGIRMNVQGGSTIRLGGTTAGSENVISGHTNGGIFVENGDMTVLRNRVFDNDERGMLLSSATDYNLNDIGDVDGMGANDANNFLNHPVIKQVLEAGSGNLQIDYDADLKAGDYLVNIFRNPTQGIDLARNMQIGEAEVFGESTCITSAGTGITEHSYTTIGGGYDVSDAVVLQATEITAGGCDSPTDYGVSSIFSNTAGVAGTGIDYGDAIDIGVGVGVDNYQTENIDNGPYHFLSPNVYLGSCVDADLGHSPSEGSTGDDFSTGLTIIGTCDVSGDDEDALVSYDLESGVVGNISIETFVSTSIASGTQIYLQAWADWDGNGDFSDAGEQIVTDMVIDSAETAIVQNIPVTAPVTVPNGTAVNLRIRISDHSGLSYIGEAKTGEVEDHIVVVGTSIIPEQPTLSSGDRARRTVQSSVNLDEITVTELEHDISSNDDGSIDVEESLVLNEDSSDIYVEDLVDPVLNVAKMQMIDSVENLQPAFCENLKDNYRKEGDSGLVVTFIQLFLRLFQGELLQIDGNFGEQTVEAVKRFQLKFMSEILAPWGLNRATGFWFQATEFKARQILGCPTLIRRLDNGGILMKDENNNVNFQGGGIPLQESVDEIYKRYQFEVDSVYE